MAITVGCFALIHPFSTLEMQLTQIQKWGFQHADITDNTDGACLGSEFGFTAVASLDANPHDLRRLFADHGLSITSFCAHANLLDPSSPWRYGTAQIIKAVRAAAAIGVSHVITTEGEPHTSFGRSLSDSQAIFSVKEKLHEPLRLAADLGVSILLEPHGYLTDSIKHLSRILNECDSPALALNLDTGNLWLGGGNPIEFIRRFGSKIRHVHWKDMPAEMASKRGKVFGCGMGLVPLGSGVVGIANIFRELCIFGFSGHTTLEVAGESAVLASRDFLAHLVRHDGLPKYKQRAPIQ
jgi:inosose dehydratase